ncbi:MAG: hypothetical protein K1Y02_15065 [Candidatus Hydrogenedentes bacterium]|nr:hypothetical protein [Candidatus Hydrogenedentota bacterium]
MRRHPYSSVAVFAWSVLVLGGFAQAEQVNLTVGNGSGYPGGNATSQVTMNATTAPAAVSFRIGFDSTKLTVTNVQAGSVVTTAQKDLEWDVPTPGTLAVAIFGVNETTIANGALATVTFSVQASVSTPSNLALDGNTQSASGADGQPLTTAIADGALSITACTTPAVPTGVSATDGSFANRVRVTWSASSGATSYLLYRSTTNNSASAALITSVVGTTYDDFSAAAATSGSSGGCGGGSSTQYTTYYYWIRAQNQCSQSALSTPDSGYRGLAKSASDATAIEMALPSKATGPVLLDSSLALRLFSEEPIDVSSVWGRVETDSLQDSTVSWVPVDGSDTDGWVVYTPQIAWVPGELIFMSAGASTQSGVALPALQYVFKADPDGAISEMGAKGVLSGASLMTVNTQDLPELSEAVGPAYAIDPCSVFSAPQTISIPIPSGIDPADVEVYYLASSSEGPVWHRGESVAGWLLESAVKGDSLAVTIRHGGIVCLGYRANLANVTTAGLVDSKGALDNVILTVLVVGALAIAHWRRSRQTQKV